MQEVTEPEQNIADQLRLLGEQLKHVKKTSKKKSFSPFCEWILDIHRIVLTGMVPGMEMDAENLSNIVRQYESEIETLPCKISLKADDIRRTIFMQKIEVKNKSYRMIATAVVESWEGVYALKKNYEKRNDERNKETDTTAMQWKNWVNEHVVVDRSSAAPVEPNMEKENNVVPSLAESTYMESHQAANAAMAALDEVRKSINEFWQTATIDTAELDTIEKLRQQEANLMQAAVKAVEYRTVARHRMLEEKDRQQRPHLLPMKEEEKIEKDDIELLKMQLLGTIQEERLRRKAFRYQEIRELIGNAVQYEISRMQCVVRTLHQTMLVQVQACDDDLNIIEQQMKRQHKELLPLPDDCDHSMEVLRRQEVFRIIKSHSFDD